MWRDAWFVGSNDLKLMLRSKETLLWTFLMPVVFFYFIGSITGAGSMLGGSEKVAVQVADDAGFLGAEVRSRLQQQDYVVRLFDADGNLADEALLAQLATQESSSLPVFGDYQRRLVIPTGFTRQVLDGEQVILNFERDGEGLGADLDAFKLNRAVYTVLADVLAAADVLGDSGASLRGLTAEDMQALHAAPRSLVLEKSQAGKRKRIPTGFEQAVPGTMVMFTLLILLTAGATSLVQERRAGLLRRLASAPIGRGAVVLGKWISKFALAALQVLFAMLLGRLAFGVHWGPALPMLLLTLAAYAAMLTSLGILVGNWARTEGQAVGIGVLSANVLGALGGCWWPIEITPRFMQKLSLYLPTGWMMDAMHKLMVFQDSWTSALPHLLGMTCLAWLLGLWCARSFRFE